MKIDGMNLDYRDDPRISLGKIFAGYPMVKKPMKFVGVFGFRI